MVGLSVLLFALSATSVWSLDAATRDPHGLVSPVSITSDSLHRVEPLYGRTWTPEWTLDWSPDGRMLALGSFTNIVVLDALTGRTLGSWSTPKDVSALRWSPDGSHIAVAGREVFTSTPGYAYVYTTEGILEHAWEPHRYYACGVAWSQMGDRLLTTSPGELALWDTQTWNEIYRAANVSTHGCSVSWSPNGSLIALGARGGPTVYDLDIGGQIWTAEPDPLPDEDLLDAQVAWSPRGDLIAAGFGNGTLHLYDPAGNLVGNVVAIEREGVQSPEARIAWNPEGSLIALALSEGVAIVSTEKLTVERLLVFPTEKHRPWMASPLDKPLDFDVAWSPRGGALASTGTTSHPSLRVWGIRNVTFAVPLLVFGISWTVGLLAVFWRTLVALIRNPGEVAAHSERDTSSQNDGVALLVFAVVSSLFLVLLGHAMDRAYGTLALPSFSWFILNGLLAVPMALVAALGSGLAFQHVVWSDTKARPSRLAALGMYGLVLAPFLLFLGLLPVTWGLAGLIGLPVSEVAAFLGLSSVGGILLGIGFYLSVNVLRNIPNVRSSKVVGAVLLAITVPLGVFFLFVFSLVLALNVLQVQPMGEFGEFGFQLLLGFGFTPLIALGIALVVGAASLTSPALIRVLLLAYHRVRGTQVLELDARRELLEIVQRNPGVHFRELLRATNMGSGTLYYHLSVLEREGLVLATRDGILKRFFANDDAP